MRTAFIDTLFELASRDSRITLVVGDLGFGVVTRFMKQLPAQFVNAGVANYHLSPSSPAVDSGLAAQAPDHDADGFGRPYGPFFDLGAFEYAIFNFSFHQFLPLIGGE